MYVILINIRLLPIIPATATINTSPAKKKKPKKKNRHVKEIIECVTKLVWFNKRMILKIYSQ